MIFQSFIFLDNGLTGTIPNLENLVLLADFNLKGNSLSGTIPQKIGQLVQLQNLDFSDNQISGSIPNTIVFANNLRDIKSTIHLIG